MSDSSKHTWNYFISEICKAVQPIKLYVLQNIPFCNYTFLSESVKLSKTFLKDMLWKTFQDILLILNYASSFTKLPSLQCRFHSKEQVKTDWMQVRRL